MQHLLDDIAISAAGTTALGLRSQAANHEVKIAVAAGAGAYTANVTLPETTTSEIDTTTVDVLDGDLIIARVEIAASANPTFRWYSGSTSGALLRTLTGDAGAARTYLFIFQFVSGAWRLMSEHQVSDRDPLTLDRTNLRVNTNIKIASGFTLTVESGGSLIINSGATMTVTGALSVGTLQIGGGTVATKRLFGRATLVAGTVTVSAVFASASAVVLVTPLTNSSGVKYVATPTPASDEITITAYDSAGSPETTDTATVAWELIEP